MIIEVQRMLRVLDEATEACMDFSEALMLAIADAFWDRSDEWQANFYALTMESDCLDSIAITRLVEVANG